MHVHVLYWHWKAPVMIQEDERRLGELVSKYGKNYFARQFRRVLGNNPLSPPIGVHLEFPKPDEDVQRSQPCSFLKTIVAPLDVIFVGLSILLCLGSTFYVGDITLLLYFIPIFSIFAGIYFFSLIKAFKKYDRWLDHLESVYLGRNVNSGAVCGVKSTGG